MSLEPYIYNSVELSKEGFSMTNYDFLKRTKTASDKEGCDYIVLDIPELSKQKLYNFELSNYSDLGKRIGDDIFFLGYPF
ncbi:MAG: hypothetical protein F6K40_01035 [Okeania sp. SIO3I5]|uniref:hypothetical protein n=1 Tax=Okeania sp. SIO3I5 TaxID=2607805 RepID=UPI0013BD5607|nr:hypothetical protein [Okeania sp. SIO3I5]NEQ34967.1 hypothetical protein [Okeania sp. SIO3I5]